MQKIQQYKKYKNINFLIQQTNKYKQHRIKKTKTIQEYQKLKNLNS